VNRHPVTNLTWRLTALLLVSIGVFPLAASAADSKAGIPRIGYLALSPILDKPSPERDGFMQGLRELGYQVGKNIQIDYFSAEGNEEMLEFQAEAAVKSGIDVIVAAGLPAIRAARDATKQVPIVMMFVGDPVPLGFARSLAEPGSNVTGMSMLNAKLGSKRLELLKQALPHLRRVAVLWDSSNSAVTPEWQSTQSAARQLHVQLVSADAAGDRDFSRAFKQIENARVDALITLVDLRTASYRYIIPGFAREHRLPTMFGHAIFVELGGLMSYAPDFVELSKRSASYVDKILKGANPAQLPIQQPTTLQLVLNLKTARAIGVQVPPDVLLRADKVIE